MDHLSLGFNIAAHILCFLAKHDSQRLSSQTLAKLTCLNLAQLCRVTIVLNQYQFIKIPHSKNGGYSANRLTASIKLPVPYRIFVLEKDNQQHTFTGHEQNDCEISGNIAKAMSHYNQKEYRAILDFYDTLTISDIINDTLQEDTMYDIL